jgi:hypothetical protein
MRPEQTSIWNPPALAGTGIIIDRFAGAQPCREACSGRYLDTGRLEQSRDALHGRRLLRVLLLPPYNTINAQLIDPNGNLVTNPGITVTYQAVADPDGSINTTSQGKTNFWQFVLPLFGASPAFDVGLTGVAMPGAGNQRPGCLPRPADLGIHCRRRLRAVASDSRAGCRPARRCLVVHVLDLLLLWINGIGTLLHGRDSQVKGERARGQAGVGARARGRRGRTCTHWS